MCKQGDRVVFIGKTSLPDPFGGRRTLQEGDKGVFLHHETKDGVPYHVCTFDGPFVIVKLPANPPSIRLMTDSEVAAISGGRR